MAYVITFLYCASTLFAAATGRSAQAGQALMEGAQAAVEFSLSLAGGICLWSAISEVLERSGGAAALTRMLRPVLALLFPGSTKDKACMAALSENVSANILGLGNAATPMGIQAAQRLAEKRKDGVAGNELCRLIVLNTASIQLIPATVAAVRSNLGCQTPFDLLPAVWITSLCSAGMGLTAAWILGKLWRP